MIHVIQIHVATMLYHLVKLARDANAHAYQKWLVPLRTADQNVLSILIVPLHLLALAENARTPVLVFVVSMHTAEFGIMFLSAFVTKGILGILSLDVLDQQVRIKL